MKFDKPYPYNLLGDIMLGEEFYSELSDAEVIREVEHVIDSLSSTYSVNKHIPKKMQTVIRLWYADGLSYKEIGQLLGVSNSRIGQMKFKALRMMRHPSRLNRLLLKSFDDE